MTTLNPDFINPKILPGLHRELVPLIGLQATLALGEAYNGVRMYVPTSSTEEHTAARLIGIDKFDVIVNHYGGEEIEFPKLDAAVRQIKVRMISEMLEAKLSTREIALNTGYTQRRVQQIKSDLGIDYEDQLSFFY